MGRLVSLGFIPAAVAINNSTHTTPTPSLAYARRLDPDEGDEEDEEDDEDEGYDIGDDGHEEEDLRQLVRMRALTPAEADLLEEDPDRLESDNVFPVHEVQARRGRQSGYRLDGRFRPWMSERTRRMFRRPRMRPSVAVENRMTGDPKWFMSSMGPSTGALLIDTDGLEIRTGGGDD